MPHRHSLLPVSLAVSLAACASVPVRQSVAPATEITLELAASPARTHDQLLSSFAANGLQVTTSQPGVIEFQAPRERGILGHDEVFARAIITPLDCGTRVTGWSERCAHPTSR